MRKMKVRMSVGRAVLKLMDSDHSDRCSVQLIARYWVAQIPNHLTPTRATGNPFDYAKARAHPDASNRCVFMSIF